MEKSLKLHEEKVLQEDHLELNDKNEKKTSGNFAIRFWRQYLINMPQQPLLLSLLLLLMEKVPADKKKLNTSA